MVKHPLIFAGDLHLCDVLFSSHPGMTGDSEFLLNQLAEICRENDAGLVLLGDIFDKRLPSPYLVSLFFQYLYSTDICFIVGQHDINPFIQWPDILNNIEQRRKVIHLNEKSVIKFHDYEILGFDHKPKSEVEEILKHIPECQILCCHQLLKEVWDQEDVWNMTLEWIPKDRVELVALGDWHKTPNEGEYNGMSWAYTGSALLRSINEPLQKSCLGLTIKKNKLSFKRLPLKTRPVIYSEVRFEKQFVEWLDTIVEKVKSTISIAQDNGVPEAVSKPLVVLRYPLNIKDISSRISSVLKPVIDKLDCFFHPMPWRPLDDKQNLEDITDSAEIDHSKIISSFVDPTTAPELYKLVSDLVATENPQDVITAFKRRRGIEENILV